MKLVFARKARQDLDTIADHIAAEDVDAALRLVLEIERRAQIRALRARIVLIIQILGTAPSI